MFIFVDCIVPKDLANQLQLDSYYIGLDGRIVGVKGSLVSPDDELYGVRSKNGLSHPVPDLVATRWSKDCKLVDHPSRAIRTEQWLTTCRFLINVAAPYVLRLSSSPFSYVTASSIFGVVRLEDRLIIDPCNYSIAANYLMDAAHKHDVYSGVATNYAINTFHPAYTEEHLAMNPLRNFNRNTPGAHELLTKIDVGRFYGRHKCSFD